ncbi:MAG: phosphoenolpyruvate--protein phosphotransferase [Candidatus Marinimicrobia bacterium]|nr:phosphoenolpyruvate--protein phosphotransferase [Candidatus Neomarinimicrobiota bacterium]
MAKHKEINFLNGLSSSTGIVIGTAYVRKLDQGIIIPRTSIPTDMIEDEMFRLKKAQDLVAEELELVKAKIEESLGTSYSDIISAQLAILKDQEIKYQVQAYIEEYHVNVAYAYKVVVNQYIELLEDHDSEYFKERVSDIRDVKQRVIRALISKQTVLSSFNIDKPTIFVSGDLNPTDIMMLVSENVIGFITEFGGKTSHVAILARAMKVPMITGAKEVTQLIESGQTCILDADTGKIFVQPSQELIDEYAREIILLNKRDEAFQTAFNKKAVTKDGYTFKLGANISLPVEVKDVKKYGGGGVGLYRTEYLYLMKQHLPEEEELFKEYRLVTEAMEGKEVVIRTMDLGGDKMSALWDQDIRHEPNPFMGYRAIRICLDKPDVFITQLRAILRSSAFGNTSILLPMITHVEQLTESLKHIEEVKKTLSKERIPYNKSIKIGMMVETPSAVINIESFIDKVDFLSIGTNDLTQYGLAVDRGNERVTDIYNHYDPAIIKMIMKVVEAGHKVNIPVFVCGEMASEYRALILFAAMKVDGLSVAPRYIGAVRNRINSCDQKKAQQYLKKVLEMKTRQEIVDYLDSLKDNF